MRHDLGHATRRPLDAQACGLMLVFCIALGLQQVAIKAVADDISPLAQIALRSVIALALIAFVARLRGVALWVPSQFGPGLVVGIGYTLEFAFVAYGLNFTYAAHMSVFLYTAPVFAAIGLHAFVAGEQLTARQWLGVIVAFGGLVIALAPRGALSMDILIGDLFGVLAGLSWAATTLTLRTTSLSEAPSLRTVAYQLGVASLVLLPAAALFGGFSDLNATPLAIASLSFQAVVVSFAALLLWFWLLRRYLASRLGVFAFLSPIFGVIFGVVLLDDPISINFAAGGLALLIGLLLVNVNGPRQRRVESKDNVPTR
ncbi:DMT family transporter [uncultured Salinisphaera sp.]|uniref:DMT family transporter n=1 Tax=uncultured Salinisphaera sp. TaxID=359372 RepID=UPI0032B14801|tara:strand:- start:542 stop:1486 length:945 start_codon:yes stop_codon:yes gene_type:complete